MPTPLRRIADQAWLLMMIPGLLWAGNAIVSRAVVGEVPPVALAFWRWTLGTLVILPFAWPHLRRDMPALRRHWRITALLAVFGIAAFNTCLYQAAQATTALNIVLLQSAMPVIIVGIGFLLFRTPVTLFEGLGILVSLAGALVLMVQGDLGALQRLQFNHGDVWMMAAVVSYAIYTALLSRRPPVHGLSMLAATFVLGATMLLPLYLLESLGGRPLQLTGTALAAISYVTLGPSILAYLCFNRVVVLLGPNTAGLTVHLVPVFGTVMAVLLLGEQLHLHHGIGFGLIAAGILLAMRKR